MNKYFLAVAIILSVIFVSGCVSSDSSSDSNQYNDYFSDYKFVELSFDRNPIILSSNETEFTVNGTTEAENIIINSEDFNISNLTIDVVNNTFSYNLKNIPKSNINIYENYTYREAAKKLSITKDIGKIEITAKSKNSSINDNKEYLSIKRTLSSAEIESDFKNKCKNVSFEELVKVNPYNFAGVPAKYSGEVINTKPISPYIKSPNFELAVDGDRNKVIYFYYNGTQKLEEGDNITVWGKLCGDRIYGPKELSSGLIYSGSSVDYGGYRGFGYSQGGLGIYSIKGTDPQYNDFYTSLGNYQFNPDADAWYLQINN